VCVCVSLSLFLRLCVCVSVGIYEQSVRLGAAVEGELSARELDGYLYPLARRAAGVCCSVLQCVAVCCSVLQCVAVCCSVLQCVAVDGELPA